MRSDKLLDAIGEVIGETIDRYSLVYRGETVSLDGLEAAYNDVLEGVYPVNAQGQDNAEKVETVNPRLDSVIAEKVLSPAEGDRTADIQAAII